MVDITETTILNTLRQRQNGRHFPDDIFKWIFLMKIYEFRLTYHWSLFQGVQLTMSDTVLTQSECLTHWGRVMHICIGNVTIIGSGNGLAPGRRQAIIWTNDGYITDAYMHHSASMSKAFALSQDSITHLNINLSVILKWVAKILLHDRVFCAWQITSYNGLAFSQYLNHTDLEANLGILTSKQWSSVQVSTEKKNNVDIWLLAN